jgi:serine protease Do
MRFIRSLFFQSLVFVVLGIFIQNIILPQAPIAFGSFADRLGILATPTVPANKARIIANDPEATEVAQAASDSVVTILGYEHAVNGGRYSSWITKVTSGTGFFVDERGYVLTNKHVVNDAGTYTVILANGDREDASVVYKDPNNDLAIIKIPGFNYPVMPLGDSSDLKIGETVVGIGNSYSRDGTIVAPGSISALNKTILLETDTDDHLRNLIQTTTQLYPGDSGGPLFTLDGEVVGINVATAVDYNNLSFSIPINDAKKVIQAALPKTSLSNIF